MRAKDILKLSFEFSSKLGVREQPQLAKLNESSVPGIHVVGDLADAPIIKVALNQGHEVACGVIKELGKPIDDNEVLDVVIVGAGPAGIGAALALADSNMRYVMLEKERPFNTIQTFPKNKLIFSEPRTIQSKGGFWFEDAAKEELVQRWDQALDDRKFILHQPEEVVNIERQGDRLVVETRISDNGLLLDDQSTGRVLPGTDSSPGAKNSYCCLKVILAIGRRGSVRKLGIPGEDRDNVDYALKDPDDFVGKRVLVVGGGDSAVEAATSIAKAGGVVTISYRQPVFSRAKAKNRELIERMIERKEIRAELSSNPKEIKPDTVTLARGDEVVEVPSDHVLIFAGTKLPAGFLKRVGIRMAGQLDALRVAWILGFAFVTYLFYVLKSKKAFWPFGPQHIFSSVPKLLEVDLGFRQVGPSFWGTCIYSLLILIFGIRAYRKYSDKAQKRRYLSLITFQWIFLFGIPELIGPLVIKLSHAVPDLLARGWKFYAISVPWPLSIWSVVDGPSWSPAKQASTGITWILIGLFVSFVVVPLYVRRHGQRFCSYMCGCGGLAETLGDFWRHLAPRGATAYRAEWFGRAIFLLAIPVTLLILNDAWQFVASGAFASTKTFAVHWYGLMVDFWLASVVGVAFYPYLGNRAWCRFFCPLRAYMELLAKRFAKITIQSNDKCIGCGECTRYCQMGIQVQRFAQQRVDMDNSNSACIQCGICVQVCPMEVLTVGKRDLKNEVKGPTLAPATGPNR